mmetsp:Transcript_52495/g.152859  ORF Transcript_52495/g.152859 Transcript_52495/m.152859 type:complete len:312 (-) Transcript_52495:223-1158(-)
MGLSPAICVSSGQQSSCSICHAKVSKSSASSSRTAASSSSMSPRACTCARQDSNMSSLWTAAGAAACSSAPCWSSPPADAMLADPENLEDRNWAAASPIRRSTASASTCGLPSEATAPLPGSSQLHRGLRCSEEGDCGSACSSAAVTRRTASAASVSAGSCWARSAKSLRLCSNAAPVPACSDALARHRSAFKHVQSATSAKSACSAAKSQRCSLKWISAKATHKATYERAPFLNTVGKPRPPRPPPLPRTKLCNEGAVRTDSAACRPSSNRRWAAAKSPFLSSWNPSSSAASARRSQASALRRRCRLFCR